MLVEKALHTTTAVLTKLDSVAEGLEQMELQDVTILPVVAASTHKLAGQIGLDTLKQASGLGQSIGELALDEPVKVFKNQHLFHAIQRMLQYELSLVPVIDKEWVFQGVIFRKQVLESLGKMLNLTEYGSIITVRLEQRDFVLSEIVHIIEAEKGKILGITVETPDAEQPGYEISIKVNLKDVSGVASALRRHGYLILTENDSESAHLDLETRADALVNYLDI